ncbi:MAG TPA: hypothetical protein VLH13_05645, partial [Methanomassiliicoccales archaeon]|nr:hypothetical protein [Methanomassiliicoccales archaeon]
QDFIWDDYTLMHEYGHSVHFAVRGGSFPEIEGPDPHYLDSESSGPSALVEGWAIFFACAVEGDANKTSRLSLESTVFADSPLFNGDYGDWDGNEVEGAVANVLWDIYDGISADDHPPWDRSGHGDGIDNEFSTFWKIFIEDRPESMDDVWAAWENKNASLAYVFRHARFDKQATLPTNPTDFVSNIEVGVTSNETSMIVSWSGATGSGSAIAGYSILWDHSPDGEPDQYIDVYGPSIQTSNMDAGTWYLHIRAVDQNGNAAIGSFDVGPFIIGSKASDAVGGSDLINTLGEIAIVAMLAVALLLLIWLVTRVVRKPTKEDVEPYIPPWQMHNPYYAPPYAPYYGGMAPLPPVMPNAPYPPPMPPTYPIQQPQGPVIRYCQGCGRPDAGGQFCPYCGTKVR